MSFQDGTVDTRLHAYECVVARVTALTQLCGDSAISAVRYDRQRLTTLLGAPCSSPVTYHPPSDTLVVHIEPVLKNSYEQIGLDGAILHALGHRRDRRTLLGLRWSAWLIGFLGLALAVTGRLQSESSAGLMLLCSVWLLLAVAWTARAFLFYMRCESRADDFAVRIGGARSALAFLRRAAASDIDEMVLAQDQPAVRLRRIRAELWKRSTLGTGPGLPVIGASMFSHK